MGPQPKLIPFAGAVLVALLCGGLAALSLSAAWIALPSGDTIDRLRKGETVSPQQIRQAAENSLRAGRMFDASRYYSDAVLAAGRLDSAAQAQVLDGASRGSLIDAALREAPVSPHNWTRRAALQIAAKDWPGARQSLEMSLLLGRYAPGLTVPRLHIILKLLNRQPDAELERHFVDQVRIAAQTEPAKLAAFAGNGAAEGRTQRALFSDFALYNAYVKALIVHRAAVAADVKSRDSR